MVIHQFLLGTVPHFRPGGFNIHFLSYVSQELQEADILILQGYS